MPAAPFKEPYTPHTDWRPPKPLAQGVARMVKETRPQRKLAETGVPEALGRAVGPQLAPLARVASIRAGRVTVEAASAGALQELVFDERRILEAIRRDPDVKPRVVELRFRVGRWET